MHIPDGFLDPKVSAGMMGAAVAVLGFCFAKLRTAVTVLKPAEAFATAGKHIGNMAGSMRRVLTGDGERTIYKMGMVAVLVFAAQMLDFPVGGGATGHIIGAFFAAIILGPYAGTIVIALVLLVQSLFFANGGIMALGANIITMGFVGSFLSYYFYYCAKKVIREWMAILIVSWFSVIAAALCYCLQMTSSTGMLKVHAIVGIVEALITLVLIDVWRKFNQS
jgi:cobalt/nickel transport system permease protein